MESENRIEQDMEIDIQENTNYSEYHEEFISIANTNNWPKDHSDYNEKRNSDEKFKRESMMNKNSNIFVPKFVKKKVKRISIKTATTNDKNSNLNSDEIPTTEKQFKLKLSKAFIPVNSSESKVETNENKVETNEFQNQTSKLNPLSQAFYIKSLRTKINDCEDQASHQTENYDHREFYTNSGGGNHITENIKNKETAFVEEEKYMLSNCRVKDDLSQKPLKDFLSSRWNQRDFKPAPLKADNWPIKLYQLNQNEVRINDENERIQLKYPKTREINDHNIYKKKFKNNKSSYYNIAKKNGYSGTSPAIKFQQCPPPLIHYGGHIHEMNLNKPN